MRLAEIAYDEYREWFSVVDENGLTLPKWDDLHDDHKRWWAKVAGAVEREVKSEISRRLDW